MGPGMSLLRFLSFVVFLRYDTWVRKYYCYCLRTKKELLFELDQILQSSPSRLQHHQKSKTERTSKQKKTPRNPMPAELHRPTTLHVLHLHPTQNINDAPKSCSITKGAMYARTQPRIRFNVGLRNVRRAPVVGIAPKDRTGTITAVHRRDPLALEGRFRSSTGTVGVAVPCEGEGRWKGQTSLRRTSACKHPLHRSIIAELHKAAVPLHLVDPVRSVVHRY